MAKSPSHKLGQIIGNVLEAAIEPGLLDIAKQHKLYLDRSGYRPARGSKKVSWKDEFGNVHDLDFVMERGGSKDKLGTPIAFIESAWRRYTKHSRNKAQEIQGAVMPLVRRYSDVAPFKGVVLAGVFTDGSLQQLRSMGFAILYLPYESVIEAFGTEGMNVRYDEDTPDSEFQKCVDYWDELGKSRQSVIAQRLAELNHSEVQLFMEELIGSLRRRVVRIRIMSLHGDEMECNTVEEAIRFVQGYDESCVEGQFVRYELEVHYSNGDVIRGNFQERADAIGFLNAVV